MQPFFLSYLSNLEELHNDIRSALQGLTPEMLDWTPGAEMNSLSVLITHLSGAERYWLGDVIAGEPSDRDRDAEFKVQGLTGEALIQHLDESDEFARKVLETLTLQELETTRVSPRNGRQVVVGWALGHALKHAALHVGHIQMIRQLLLQRGVG
jgi:uncharacterized damage-inducible protein DinB